MFSLLKKSNTEKTLYRGNQIQRKLCLQRKSNTEKALFTEEIKYRESSVYRGTQIQRRLCLEEIKHRESSVYRGNQIQRKLRLQRKSNTEKALSTEETKFSVLNISDTKSYYPLSRKQIVPLSGNCNHNAIFDEKHTKQKLEM